MEIADYFCTLVSFSNLSMNTSILPNMVLPVQMVE